jgi:hypothetical protein
MTGLFFGGAFHISPTQTSTLHPQQNCRSIGIGAKNTSDIQ